MESSTYQPVYLSAVLLATFSFVIMLLIIPPMFWHFRNRNIGAMSLVAWTVIALLFNFINALIWPNDNTDTWFNGAGLCDVETKMMIASQVAVPASFACVLRALANVLNVERATVLQTQAQRRRNYIVDILWCMGFPILQMPLQYIVQPSRYYIVGIAGCAPSADDTWLAFSLLILPPTIWVIIDTYYAVLILIRLYRYRLTFNSILASNSTTKSRFMRLYIICMLWITCALPVQAYVIYSNATFAEKSFHWSDTHNAENWGRLELYFSNGSVLYDRWIPVGTGIVVFVFFGLGKEALKMYRTGLLTIGLGRIIPSLNSDHRSSIAQSVNSFSSKAKMLFKRKDSPFTSSTWTSGSEATMIGSTTDPTSPQKMDFLETIDEKSCSPQQKLETKPGSLQYDAEATMNKHEPSMLQRLTSVFQKSEHPSQCRSKVMPLSDIHGQPQTVHAEVTGGRRISSFPQYQDYAGDNEVCVKTVVRQNSEHC